MSDFYNAPNQPCPPQNWPGQNCAEKARTGEDCCGQVLGGPIPPVAPGCNPQEQMRHVIERVNECIAKWNYVQGNCFEALERTVGASLSRDVYYDMDEVKYEVGYDTTDGCAYQVVRIKPCDKAGRPIRVRLGLAYDNATNSNVRQSIEDYSFIKSAQCIITAVDPAQEGWNGPAMKDGATVNGTTSTDTYVYGFNKLGALRVFKGDVSAETLIQNGMVDVIGAGVPIVLNGSVVTDTTGNLTTKSAITAVGWIESSREVVFVSCGYQEDSGMTGAVIASLMANMGCATAVITGIQTTSDNGTIDMEYLGKYANQPIGYVVPKNVAYWYVTKRPEPCHC